MQPATSRCVGGDLRSLNIYAEFVFRRGWQRVYEHYVAKNINLMRRKPVIMAIIGIAVCIALTISGWMLSDRIRIGREDRERHFVTVHYLAMQSIMESDDEAPKTMDELMEKYAGGGVHSALLVPFRNGLTYGRTPGGFELSEPVHEYVSLFRRDRLIASDHEWPHWESSGLKVWKFSGQQIPPNYLNAKDITEQPATRTEVDF